MSERTVAADDQDAQPYPRICEPVPHHAGQAWYTISHSAYWCCWRKEGDARRRDRMIDRTIRGKRIDGVMRKMGIERRRIVLATTALCRIVSGAVVECSPHPMSLTTPCVCVIKG